MTERLIVKWSQGGSCQGWLPTTLDKLGKDERFFEDVLAESPGLLCLESRRTGIRGPFHLFRQVTLETPSGRSITPDIVLFAASGHVIVVEVKRYVNPELRQRAVIAQIVDYAASFSALPSEECTDLFMDGHSESWTEYIATIFPAEPDPEELADLLLHRMASGELNLVIACDKSPPGLIDAVAGISSQSTIAFELELVEVVPYVPAAPGASEIIFAPTVRLQTEIVSRTAVTVTYRTGDAQPSTSVQTTSLHDIEENIKTAGKEKNFRNWSLAEVEQEFQRQANPIALELLEFAKRNSADGQFVATGTTSNANLGLYVQGVSANGKPDRKMVFNCQAGGNKLYMLYRYASRISDQPMLEEFRQRIIDIFGGTIDQKQTDPSIPLSEVAKHMQEFQDTLLWFKDAAGSRRIET